MFGKIKIDKKQIGVYFFLLPALLLYFVFVLYPILFNFGYSLFHWLGAGPLVFVGFANYIELFKSGIFYNALKNTIVFFTTVFPIRTFLAFILAVFLSQKFRQKPMITKGNAFFRSIFLIPLLPSLVVSGYTWSFILRHDGPLNVIFNSLNIKFMEQSWIGNPKLALFSIAMVQVWNDFGYFVLIFYANLINIPEDLYEAADIDGANFIKKIWHISIPACRPSLIIVTIISFVGLFHTFDLPYIMTKGGPGHASETVALLLVKQLGYYKFGQASAMSSILSIIVLLCSFLYLSRAIRSEVK